MITLKFNEEDYNEIFVVDSNNDIVTSLERCDYMFDNKLYFEACVMQSIIFESVCFFILAISDKKIYKRITFKPLANLLIDNKYINEELGELLLNYVDLRNKFMHSVSKTYNYYNYKDIYLNSRILLLRCWTEFLNKVHKNNSHLTYIVQ